GKVASLRYREDDPMASGTAIFGPLAAWYVTDILSEAPPPPGVSPPEVRRGRRLAFKTGTPYGFRDFWPLGYDTAGTVGGGAGRPEAPPCPGHRGGLPAAPVLFKIADLLGPPRSASTAAPPPGALQVRRAGLPPRLQRLEPGMPGTSRARGPEIVYPPD